MTLQRIKKALILAFILAFFIGFFYFDGHLYLTFESLKRNNVGLKIWATDNILLASSSFFIVYLISTALSLPGAVVFTLASGLIFGLGLGTLIASFASTMGACLAFLGARYFFKDWVQAKFSHKLIRINEGFKTQGAYYLFTLRLMPLMPFFVLNLLMGLTPIKLWTYYWVSQIAMLPATFIFVNAGTQLSEIESPQDILSPKLILSLVLLGFFPLIIKTAMSRIKGKPKI
jgi:uncharacterized membrane protein YdjX (TVP38/TMEM64 family)